ncbi:hypothetical protein COB72_03455 [bacterium]|nr:MAG: hypothetical protein COB72_03455 [bacterium]
MTKTEATLPIADIKAFEKHIRDLGEDMRDGVLIETAEGIVGEAQFEAPVLTGALAESHTVSEPDEGSIIVGANTPYAMAVHETHPTKAHWFINAINRNFKRISGRAIEKALREGGAR